MTIAEKLTLIAQNEQKVYDAGYEKGKSEGAGEVKLQEKTITENGVYTPTEDYDGFSKVIVDVESSGGGVGVLQEKTITENGVYTPDEGFDGFSKVAVNVESGASGDLPTLFVPTIVYTASNGSLSITDNGNGKFAVSYALYADDIYKGETTKKNVKLADYVETPTETKRVVLKVIAKAKSFNNSDYSNEAYFDYVAASSGTPGLAYTLSSSGTSYTCTGLGTAETKDIEIASEIDGIPVTGFSNFKGLVFTSLKLPATIKSISKEALMNCSDMISIELPAFLERIFDYAFSGCRKLESITIPSSVIYIGSSSFYGCTGLKAVYISSLEQWCSFSFSYDYSPLYLSGGNLYLNGELVTDLVIPNTVNTINSAMFAGGNFKTVTIPSSVTSIGSIAFYLCKNLKRMDFSTHTSVPALGNKNAFSGTHADLQIKVPASLIDEWKAATNWSTYADKIVTEFTNTL